MKKILLLLSVFVTAFTSTMVADDYIVIGHEGKVFDRPNSKNFTTTNRDGEDVVLSEGMVFKKKETRQGWDMIEYSPGLNGFILQSLEENPNSLSVPASGSYQVLNMPGTNAEITGGGTGWAATVGNKKYAGQLHDGAVVFYSAEGDIILSLVKKGGKTYVYSYSNDVTKFF